MDVNNPRLAEYLVKGAECHKYLQEQIWVAQCRTVDQYNHKRKDIEFKVGDLVYINRKNWKTRRPTPKLDTRFAAKTSSLSQRSLLLAEPPLPDEELKFEVEAIVGKCTRNHEPEYKVLCVSGRAPETRNLLDELVPANVSEMCRVSSF
ncbi:hypothetical protein NDA13_001744 [Ustilago tritici]|nr:hypothetical protein NDA13_001744 [Ustilago tritici]